jgi:hypothetical protein
MVYRQNARSPEELVARCFCRQPRPRGALTPCDCGDTRPPFFPECDGFVAHPKHPLLCVQCGCGKAARDEHSTAYEAQKYWDALDYRGSHG